MQSGITASQDLLNWFNNVVSSPTLRGLIAGIEKEELIPFCTIPLKSPSFLDDLQPLQTHLTSTKAAYILLKTHPEDSNGFAAITYVPNAAPVREKTLFASTRLTLVRELGVERFREQLFVTEKEEVTKEGWERHVAHSELAAPLTVEETDQAGLRDVEARETGGTGSRKGHTKVDALKKEDGLAEGVRELMREGSGGLLVQLKFDLPDETLRLASSTPSVSPSDLASTLSQTDPRLSFYSFPSTSPEPKILYIYTCPTASKVKERMMYSTSKTFTRLIAQESAGVVVAKSIEASDPSDMDIAELEREFGAKASGEEQTTSTSRGFARPKRAGKR
nr:hypothetical protein B0A51_08616 [Rachicladosporium sp. CCFEE 5018]